MSDRGTLQSSIAVKALHESFSEEFHASRRAIVSTISDSLKSGSVHFDRQSLHDWAHVKLKERQMWLDRDFKERAEVSLSGLKNQSLTEPFTNVAQYYDHASQEMDIELSVAFDEYERSLGVTLYDRVLNGFKNRPIVVIGSFVVLVLLALFEAICKFVS